MSVFHSSFISFFPFSFSKTGSCWVAQVGLKPMILGPQPLSSGIIGTHHHTSPSMVSSCDIFKLENFQVAKIRVLEMDL